MVGDMVGDMVGGAVGDAEGLEEGSLVGLADGSEVGSEDGAVEVVGTLDGDAEGSFSHHPQVARQVLLTDSIVLQTALIRPGFSPEKNSQVRIFESSSSSFGDVSPYTTGAEESSHLYSSHASHVTGQ